MTPLFRLLVGMMVCSGFALSANAARVYYTDQPNNLDGSVMSVRVDGMDQRVVTNVPAPTNLRGIGFHRASGRIYYLDNGSAKRIYAINPDGTDAQEIAVVDPLLVGSDLEIDSVSNQLYWVENNPGTTGNGFIRRADLNGSNAVSVVTTAAGRAVSPYFLFVDAPAGYIYWGVLEDNGPTSFRRANLSGTIDPSFLITTPTRTRDIAIDPRTSIAYWCDRQNGTIYKRSLTGGVNQVVIGGMNAPHGIALDIEAQKVYWADTGARGSGAGLSSRRVARCNFDGTEYENVSTPASNSEAWDLALDLSTTNYTDWKARFFTVTATNANPLDDPDADGAPNLLEYALGTHPRRAAEVPKIVSASQGLTYLRRRTEDLAFRVEVTTSLTSPNWRYNGDGSGSVWTVEVTTPVNEDYEAVTVAPGPDLQDPQAFFRVRAALH